MTVLLPTILLLLFLITKCEEFSRSYATERKNWALHKHTTASSKLQYHDSGLAVDGDLRTVHEGNRFCFQVDNKDSHPWWAVDLNTEIQVTEVYILGKADGLDKSLTNLLIKVFRKEILTGICAADQDGLQTGVPRSFRCFRSLPGRYVNISQSPPPQSSPNFILCEVKVFGWIITKAFGRLDWARGMPTRQSTRYMYRYSKNAVDLGGPNSCSETLPNDKNPWWIVNLNQKIEVYSVVLVNRADCCGERLHDFSVEVLQSSDDQSPVLCARHVEAVKQGGTIQLFCNQPIPGSHVRVRKHGPVNYNDALTLCHVEIYGTKIVDIDIKYKLRRDNLAVGKRTMSSSIYRFAWPDRAVDGIRNNNLHGNSCFHSSAGDKRPWWKVDLGENFYVDAVLITNRGDESAYRFHHIVVYVDDIICNRHTEPEEIPGRVIEFVCEQVYTAGRFVTVLRTDEYPYDENIITICEVEVYGSDQNRNWILTVPFTSERNGPNFKAKSNPSWLAMDGNVSTNMDLGCCSSYSSTDGVTEWFAILGKNIHVTKSVIITPFVKGEMFLPFFFHVDDFELYHEGNVPSGLPIVLRFNQPPYGSTIKVNRTVSFTHLVLCEVEVYGYP